MKWIVARRSRGFARVELIYGQRAYINIEGNKGKGFECYGELHGLSLMEFRSKFKDTSMDNAIDTAIIRFNQLLESSVKEILAAELPEEKKARAGRLR